MAHVKKILERCEIPVEDTWAVEDLYPTDDAWEQELKSLDQDRNLLASFVGKLCENADNLYNYLEAMEQMEVKADRLGNYASRKADVDTRVATYQAMSGRYMTAVVALNAATSFETPEIMAISDEQLDAFYAQCPKLERYRRYISNLLRRKEHVLSPFLSRLPGSRQ